MKTKKLSELSRKELLSELGRWMKKVEDQNKEILKLKEKNTAFEAGALQLNRIVDSIMVEVAKKFGKEVGEGIFEAVIPAPIVSEAPTVNVFTIKGENTYTIRIEPIKNAKF